MTEILVAHAPAAKKRAAVVTEELAALGYKVEASAVTKLAPHQRRELDGAVAKASAVLVLWSKDAAFSPGVLAAAHRARAAGKLTLARLDASAPPNRLVAIDLSAWRGFAKAKAWKRLLARLPMAPAVHAKPKTKRGASPQTAKAKPAKPKESGGVLWWVLGVLAAGAAAGVYFTLFA